MAAEGVRFTSFYVQTVCTPSRAALLTGCYPVRVGLPNVLGANAKIGINSSEATLAELLKSRGYATTCIGKWHLGHLPQFLPTRHGFDSYFGLPYSNDMDKNGAPPIPLMRAEKIIEQPADQNTLTQRYTREAVRFIEANKDRPFLLYLPHTMVHVPLHVSDGFRGKSKRGLYGDAAEEIDWSTGQILDTLKRLGLDDNTIVLFTSDNGPWLVKKEDGGCALPLRDGKGTTYDGGVRVPCVVRWPGKIPAGTVCAEMATAMDILPTFSRLAGASVPTDRTIDGRDIWPLMSGAEGASSPHEALFFYRANRLQAMRSGKWKLILPQDGSPTALYDLEADIGESKDVSGAYPIVVRRLSEMAQKCREDIGDAITGIKGRNCRPPGSAR
jgi:arylsulfatase A-like enzyme